MAASELTSLAMAASFLKGTAFRQQGRGVVVGEARHVGPGLHVRQLELEHLILADLVAERLPLVDVAQALVDATLGQPHREGGDGDPPFVENAEELGVAPPHLAQQVRFGHPAIAKRQLSGVRRQPSHLRVLLGHREPRCPRRDDDGGDIRATTFTPSGHGGHGHQPGDVGARVGDEGLGPVDDPLAPL
jgi:hypothetical protein